MKADLSESLARWPAWVGAPQPTIGPVGLRGGSCAETPRRVCCIHSPFLFFFCVFSIGANGRRAELEIITSWLSMTEYHRRPYRADVSFVHRKRVVLLRIEMYLSHGRCPPTFHPADSLTGFSGRQEFRRPFFYLKISLEEESTAPHSRLRSKRLLLFWRRPVTVF